MDLAGVEIANVGRTVRTHFPNVDPVTGKIAANAKSASRRMIFMDLIFILSSVFYTFAIRSPTTFENLDGASTLPPSPITARSSSR